MPKEEFYILILETNMEGDAAFPPEFKPTAKKAVDEARKLIGNAIDKKYSNEIATKVAVVKQIAKFEADIAEDD